MTHYLAAGRGKDRGGGGTGRNLRHPDSGQEGSPGYGRHRGRVQEPVPRRARLPHHQNRRPGPPADLPLPRGPRPRAHPDLHARRICCLAPAQGPRPAHVHRRAAPARASPVAPARRSAHAGAKAAIHASPDGQTLRSFRGLLGHLATLTRSTIRLGDITFEKISDPTPAQRRAFDLIGAPIPLDSRPEVDRTPSQPGSKPPAQRQFHLLKDTKLRTRPGRAGPAGRVVTGRLSSRASGPAACRGPGAMLQVGIAVLAAGHGAVK